jgi:hypothetical protein
MDVGSRSCCAVGQEAIPAGCTSLFADRGGHCCGYCHSDGPLGNTGQGDTGKRVAISYRAYERTGAPCAERASCAAHDRSASGTEPAGENSSEPAGASRVLQPRVSSAAGSVAEVADNPTRASRPAASTGAADTCASWAEPTCPGAGPAERAIRVDDGAAAGSPGVCASGRSAEIRQGAQRTR